ncbi:MAG TPA: ThiF family adenylyltransferase [Puia sp.]|jgi:hypothetical protein
MEVAAQYGRVKGGEWFSLLHKKDIMVLGQGGIGSWTSLLISRIGCNLYLFDHDRFEQHNMSGQLVRAKDINKRKTDAVTEIIKEFSPDATVESDGMYKEDSSVSNIMICGFDNMEARKLAFRKWREFLMLIPESQRKYCFFQDGRLNAELLQIFNIPGDDYAFIEEYESTHLFNGDEVPPQPCTFSQTTHCAAMIAGHMVGFLTNWITNANSDTPMRAVPHFWEYIAPLNLML